MLHIPRSLTEPCFFERLSTFLLNDTGAGNGFLGGLTSYLSQIETSQSKSTNVGSTWSLDQLEEAAIHGSVSACE